MNGLSRRVWGMFLLCVVSLNGLPLTAADGPVTALAFSPDGTTLLAAGPFGVDIYSWPTLDKTDRLETGLESIHDLRFSEDGTRLAIAGGRSGQSGTLTIIDWSAGRITHAITEDTDVFYGVCWLENATHLAVASMDGTAAVVTLADDGSIRLQRRYTGHSRAVVGVVNFVAADPGNNSGKSDRLRLVTASADHSMHIWRSMDGMVERVLNNHTAPITSISMRPSSDRTALPFLASASADRTVRFWQPHIGRMVRFSRLPAAADCTEWSADGRRLLVGCRDGYLRQLDPETAAVLSEQFVQDAWIMSLAIHARQSDAAAGTAAGSIVRISQPVWSGADQ